MGSCARGRRAHGAPSLPSAPPKCCSHACACLKKNQAALRHRLPVGILKEEDVGSNHPDPTLPALPESRSEATRCPPLAQTGRLQ